MRKRNLKKGVAVELSLIILIIVTFSSALILSLAVISTKEKKDAFASLSHRVRIEEAIEEMLLKKVSNSIGDGIKLEVNSSREFELKKKDSNLYTLEVIEGEDSYSYDVDFKRNERVEIKELGSTTVLLTVEFNYSIIGTEPNITIKSWQY